MTVVPMRPSMRPRTYTSREAFIDALCHEIRMTAMTYEQLAEAAGVTRQTITRLSTGKTQWPRPATTFGIINALGLAIRLEKSD
jgi:transcriptional regulator with XRE-family HTH domain